MADKSKIRKRIKIWSIIAVLGIVVVVTVCLLVRLFYPYDTNWILGKTSEEIQEKYGAFYSYREGYYNESQQKYINGSAKYVTKWAWDEYEQEYFLISFDETGKACKVTEKYMYPVT
ncbi:MAG: hypothetical protein IJX74_04270 [Clostridia bacterium]|nr:hypothetical protein [Clostridia bacterium]